jgi:hypothetical protein
MSYFPGDPPLRDLLFDMLVLGASLAGIAWLSLRLVVPQAGRKVRRAFGVLSIACLLGAVPASWVVIQRHTGAWQELRVVLRTRAAAIRADVADPDAILTPEQFQSLRTKHVPQAVPVELPGYGIVHVRMSHGVPPYVGVDFRDGGHAVFDPTTMFCGYTD